MDARRQPHGLRSRRFLSYDCNHADPVMQAQARKATNRVSAPLHLIALPLLMMIVACVHDRSSRPVTAEPPASQPTSAAVTATVATPQPEADMTAPAPEVAPTQTNAPSNPPATPSTQSPGGPSGPATSRTRPSNPPTNPVVTPRAPATLATPPASVAVAAPAASRPPVAAARTLDLNGLEQRLRDTHAIGLFTKLSLKNQVDDLLAQFKAFHQGQSGNTLEQLRQKYELLLMKVVSLLQDGDPALASAVLSSREAIWSILTDPKRFAAI